MRHHRDRTVENRGQDRRSRRVLCIAFVLAIVPMAALISGSGSSGLQLNHDYVLPIHLEQDAEILVDTEYCDYPYVTGEGWVHGWLRTDSSGDIELVGGIPPWSPTLGTFTFCGDDLLPWDEGTYSVELTEYDVLSGGNKLRLFFDLPNTDDDLTVILVRNTPRFEIQWAGKIFKGVALPFKNKPFQWTVE